uniref:Putative kunitz domain protein n=1 Tax=Amblyomma cajennense TaxID=34607 RepID=A0A023FTE6_AMBCJ
MKFLAIILLSCWSGPALGSGGAMIEQRTFNWPLRPDCFRQPDHSAKSCGRQVFERRFYYDTNKQKCTLFIRPKCDDDEKYGKFFKRRRPCIKKCMQKSPCLKKTWKNDTGSLDGFAYYPPLDLCTSIKYEKSAKLWPSNNIFSTAEECQTNCAPADPIYDLLAQ